MFGIRVQVYGDLDTGAHNLAKSLIPTGSSESNKWGPFEQATDGLYMQVPRIAAVGSSSGGTVCGSVACRDVQEWLG